MIEKLLKIGVPNMRYSRLTCSSDEHHSASSLASSRLLGEREASWSASFTALAASLLTLETRRAAVVRLQAARSTPKKYEDNPKTNHQSNSPSHSTAGKIIALRCSRKGSSINSHSLFVEKPVFVCIVLKHQADVPRHRRCDTANEKILRAPDFSVILKTFICPITPILIQSIRS